jgi:hypothetical protein
MAKFEVVLKNDKTRQYDRMALFIILLNIAIFILTVFYSSGKNIRMIALGGAVFSALLLIISQYTAAGKKSNGRIYKHLPLLLITITWGLLGNWWGACICLALGLLFQVSQRQLAVGVGKEAILYPSFPKKTIQWNELNNLVLKDGLLTIDFKNNKILQSEIINSSVELNEKEFNDFCREQLH